MHVLPDLARLEKKYPNELVIIGVHSAKFPTERLTENIRQAVRRYQIKHPVVNDRDMVIWRQYGVHAWPTLVLIDPSGKALGYLSGEGVYEPLNEIIGNVIKESEAKGLLHREPARFELERAPSGLLSFPGKVLADTASQRLFISDSNHNRIVVSSLADGNIRLTIGSGDIGFTDGDFERAAFNRPQGMTLNGNRLYVADTENHAIRLLDLEKKTVATLAGTGEQAHAFNQPGVGRNVSLNSPWDLTLYNDDLYIAMAGSHQIWKLSLKTVEAAPYAGSGQESIVDGLLSWAALAQPSGITNDGRKLYFADGETSAVRSADLNPKGRVETIVGLGLFEFGDRDGTGDEVRLQHPIGICYHDGALYVADTYNNKIKKVDLPTRATVTLFGAGEAGLRDGDSPLFDEPSGLSVAGDKLYIADTNNHAIRVGDLQKGGVTTFTLKP